MVSLLHHKKNDVVLVLWPHNYQNGRHEVVKKIMSSLLIIMWPE